MLIESKSLKEVLIKVLEDFRSKARIASTASVRASIENVSRVLENLLVFIHTAERANESQEEFMSKLQSSLVSAVVSLEDIEIRRRSSELENELKAIMDGLKPGEAALMSDKIRYNHLSTKISQMRSRKSVPDNIHVVKRGDKCYLLKK